MFGVRGGAPTGPVCLSLDATLFFHDLNMAAIEASTLTAFQYKLRYI
jgi:hypothetical protein